MHLDCRYWCCTCSFGTRFTLDASAYCIVYRGEALPELDGWYVYADFCSGKVWAANTADESEPVLLAETGLSIASFAELPDGEIVALTFGNEIALLERS